MDYEYENEDANASTKLTYLLIGGGIGAILALLFAPKSGQELREDIADVTKKGIEKGKETAEHLQEAAGDYYEVTRERAGELYETAQQKTNELTDKAKATAGDITEKAKSAAAQSTNPISAAIDAGKQAYAQEKRKNESKSIADGRPSYPVEDEVLEVPSKNANVKKKK